jgi:hypothetical protein
VAKGNFILKFPPRVRYGGQGFPAAMFAGPEPKPEDCLTPWRI